MFKTIGRVIPLQNQKMIGKRKVMRIVIPLLGAIIFLSPLAKANAEYWTDKQVVLSIEEYFDLLFATRFQNLNPTEPISVDFVPNKSKNDAIIFVVRPVVTPDFDLTDQSTEKAEILNAFRNNVNKQATAHIDFTRKLLNQTSVQERWPGARVEQNFAIRFVKADNIRQTVAITSNAKTVFEPNEISKESLVIKPRAGELWIE